MANISAVAIYRSTLHDTDVSILIGCLRLGYLLVFEVGFLGGDASPAGLQLSGPLLEFGQVISGGGRRGRGVIGGLHCVRTLVGVVINHLLLPLCKHAQSHAESHAQSHTHTHTDDGLISAWRLGTLNFQRYRRLDRTDPIWTELSWTMTSLISMMNWL